MKRFYLSLLFIILNLFLIGQIRLTSIGLEKDELRKRYLTTFDEEDYLIEISPANDVYVFKVNYDKSIKFLHSKNCDKIYNAANLFIFKDLMVYSQSFGVSIFNYVTGNNPSTTTSSDWLFFGSWLTQSADGGIFSAGSVPNAADRLINIFSQNDLERLPFGYNYISSFGRNIFCSLKVNDQNNYFIYDSKDEVFDYLFTTNRDIRISLDKDLAWFIDPQDNALVQYDILKRKRKEFGIYSKYNFSKSVVFTKNDQALIYSGSTDSLSLEIFNISSKELLSNTKIGYKGFLVANQIGLVNDMVVFKSVKNKIVYLDPKDNFKINELNVNSGFNLDFSQIRDNKLIYPYKKEINVFDFNNLTANKNIVDFNTEIVNGINTISVNDGLLFCMKSNLLLSSQLYMVDKNNYLNEFILSESYPSGCKTDVKIHQVDNTIYLEDEYLYEINDKEVKISNEPFVEYKSQVLGQIDGKLYFSKISNNTTTILSVKNGVVDTLVSFPSIFALGHVIKKGDFLLFYNVYSDVVAYNVVKNKIEKIYKNVEYQSFVGNRFFASINGVLNELNDDGSWLIYPEIKAEFLYINLFKLDNKFFALSGYNLFELKDNKSELVYQFGSEFPNYIQIGNKLFVQDFNYSTYEYEYKVVAASGVTLLIKPAYIKNLIPINFSNNLFLFKSDGRSAIYDDSKISIVELPTEQRSKNWKYLYVTQKDTFGLIQEPKGLVSYKVSNNFNQFEELDNLDISDQYYWFISKGDYLVVLSNDKNFILNKDGKIIKMSVGSGQITYDYIGCKENVIYFIGNELSTGRQVYKYSLDLVYSNVVINFNDQIKVFPVPSSNFVNFTLPTNNLHQVFIFDQAGKLVKEDFIDGKLDISGLSNGLHFAVFPSLKSKAVKFIKIQ